MISIGSYQISQVILERFSLDGGAMFGAVPKTLWSKKIEPDDKNRISMVTRVLVIEGEGKRILVDTGCGNKWSEKLRDIYQIENIKSVKDACADPTDIILTHLHFDHGAGLTQAGGELTFPNAELHINKSHYKHALNPGPRERASYLEENIKPLEKAKINFTSNKQEVFPGIRLFQSDGHTKGMQWLTISSTDSKQTLAYPTDLIPTSRHIPPAYVMGYDLHAEKSMAEKQAFLDQAVQNNWLIVFEHDFDTPAGHISQDNKGNYKLSPHNL